MFAKNATALRRAVLRVTLGSRRSVPVGPPHMVFNGGADNICYKSKESPFVSGFLATYIANSLRESALRSAGNLLGAAAFDAIFLAPDNPPSPDVNFETET